MKENNNQPSPEQERARAVIRQFVRADRLHRQVVEATVTAQTGVHRSQHMLLMRLARGCIPSQTQLAKEMNVSPAAIAVSLKRLESDGYITRDADADDCRCNRITLTDKGHTVVDKTHALFQTIDVAMVQGFDDAQINVLLSALEKIEHNLQMLLDSTNTPL